MEHPFDVFDEDEPRAGLDDDAAGWPPKVPLVLFAELLARDGVRLARDAANEAIHDSTPRAAVEGSHIRPDRRWSQEFFFHRRCQSRDGDCFPLHAHDRARTWNCQLDAEIEPCASGAEADVVEALGTYSHIHGAPRSVEETAALAALMI